MLFNFLSFISSAKSFTQASQRQAEKEPVFSED
jgi:hypothetical protein